VSHFYKAANGRLIARARSGQFRRSTLADIGLACCAKCKVIFTPARPPGDINPRDFHTLQRFCPKCL